MDVVQLVSGGGLRDPRTKHSFAPAVFFIPIGGASGCVECGEGLNPFTAALVGCLNCKAFAHRKCLKMKSSRCIDSSLSMVTSLAHLPPHSPLSPPARPSPPHSPGLSTLSPSLALRGVGKKLRILLEKIKTDLLHLPSSEAHVRNDCSHPKTMWESAVEEIYLSRNQTHPSQDDATGSSLDEELASADDDELLALVQFRLLNNADSAVGRGVARLQGKFMSLPCPALQDCPSEPFDDDWHDNPSALLISEARACLDAALLLTLTTLPPRVLDSSDLLSELTNLVDRHVLGFAERAMYHRVTKLCALRSTARKYAIDEDKVSTFLSQRDAGDIADSALVSAPSVGLGPAAAAAVAAGEGLVDGPLAAFHLDSVSRAVAVSDKASHLVRALQCVSAAPSDRDRNRDRGDSELRADIAEEEEEEEEEVEVAEAEPEAEGKGRDVSNQQGGSCDADDLLYRFTLLLLAASTRVSEASDTLLYWSSEIIYLREMRHREDSEQHFGIREYACTVLETAVTVFFKAQG